MDGYPMPVADLLVDAVARHRIISFMDGNAGYNQIFMAKEDIPKIFISFMDGNAGSC